MLALIEDENDAEIMRIIRNTGREFLTGNPEYITIQDQRWWYHNVYYNLNCDGEMGAFLYMVDDEAIGYGIIKDDGYFGWLTGVIKPEYRAKGHGRKLFQELIDFCNEYDLIPMLDVLISNEVAHKLYFSLGFRVTKVLENKYVMEYRYE